MLVMKMTAHLAVNLMPVAYFLGKAEQLALELDMADEIEPF